MSGKEGMARISPDMCSHVVVDSHSHMLPKQATGKIPNVNFVQTLLPIESPLTNNEYHITACLDAELFEALLRVHH